MSHIPYTISRSGCYYYNRRVPKHAVKAYGNFIRIALSKCPQESEEYAKRLSYVLEGSWRDKHACSTLRKNFTSSVYAGGFCNYIRVLFYALAR